MRHRLLVFVVGAILLLGAVAFLKKRRAADPTVEKPAQTVERKRVESFWQLYQEATSARAGGDFLKAGELYRKALELKPDHEDSLYYLGNCLFETGQYAEAADQYRRITRANPESQRAFSQLGVTLSTLAPAAPFDPSEAESSFRGSVRINSEESGPFLRLGLLSLNVGDSKAALQHFRTAAGFRSPEGCFQAGAVMFSQGRFQEAGELFREVLRMNAREKAITGRGVLSEGDVLTSRQSLTALEAAGVKSLLYLAWTAARLGGYSPDVEREFRVRLGHDHPSTVKPAPLPPLGGLVSKATRAAWADYDRDGDEDVAISLTAGGIEIYQNTAGRLVKVGQLGRRDVPLAGDLAWGDYDRDGRADLFVPGRSMFRPESGAVFQNTSRGFVNVTEAVGIAGERVTMSTWVGDLDQDGRSDLLEAGCSGSNHPSVRFYRNAGSRFREVSREAGLSVEGNATDCLVEDFNKDGYLDVVVLRWKRPALLFLANQPGKFRDPVLLMSGPSTGYSCVTLDYNRDSHPDLLLTAHAAYELAAQNLINPELGWPAQTSRLLAGDGHGGFKDVTEEVGLDRCYGVVQAAVADIDGDHWPDLVLANGGPELGRLEPSVILRNETGNRFRPFVYLPDITQPGRPHGVTVTDLDKDSQPEVWLTGVGVFEIQAAVPKP